MVRDTRTMGHQNAKVPHERDFVYSQLNRTEFVDIILEPTGPSLTSQSWMSMKDGGDPSGKKMSMKEGADPSGNKIILLEKKSSDRNFQDHHD